MCFGFHIFFLRGQHVVRRCHLTFGASCCNSTGSLKSAMCCGARRKDDKWKNTSAHPKKVGNRRVRIQWSTDTTDQEQSRVAQSYSCITSVGQKRIENRPYTYTGDVTARFLGIVSILCKLNTFGIPRAKQNLCFETPGTNWLKVISNRSFTTCNLGTSLSEEPFFYIFTISPGKH